MPGSRNGDVRHGGSRAIVFVLAVDRSTRLTSAKEKHYLAKLCPLTLIQEMVILCQTL